MIYSKSAEYAIQAMIYLALNGNNDKIMVSEIAENYDIPRHFLAKLVQSLAKHHLVQSTRGRGGGIRLNKPASEIKIIDIVRAVDGPPPEVDMCVIGLDECSDDVPCPLHEQWKLIKDQISALLNQDNLENLAREVIKKREQLNLD